jgi:hypothetical protein
VAVGARGEDGGNGMIYLIHFDLTGFSATLVTNITQSNMGPTWQAGSQVGYSLGVYSPTVLVSGRAGSGIWLIRLSTVDAGVLSVTHVADGVNGGPPGPSVQTGSIFGYSIAPIADLDSDGIPELVASDANLDDGGPRRGAVYVLFMAANLTVKSYQKISESDGNVPAGLGFRDQFLFGSAVEVLPPVSASEAPRLVVCAFNAGSQGGRAFVFSLESSVVTTGSVTTGALISPSTTALSTTGLTTDVPATPTASGAESSAVSESAADSSLVLIIVLSVTVAVVLLALFVALVLYRRKRRASSSSTSDAATPESLQSPTSTTSPEGVDSPSAQYAGLPVSPGSTDNETPPSAATYAPMPIGSEDGDSPQYGNLPTDSPGPTYEAMPNIET